MVLYLDSLAIRQLFSSGFLHWRSTMGWPGSLAGNTWLVVSLLSAHFEAGWLLQNLPATKDFPSSDRLPILVV
jgi:hypothetical protein